MLESLLTFIVIAVIVGLIVWVINAHLPLDPPFKAVILVAAVLVLLLVFLRMVVPALKLP
jgi:hypothetical protein